MPNYPNSNTWPVTTVSWSRLLMIDQSTLGLRVCTWSPMDCRLPSRGQGTILAGIIAKVYRFSHVDLSLSRMKNAAWLQKEKKKRENVDLETAQSDQTFHLCPEKRISVCFRSVSWHGRDHNNTTSTSNVLKTSTGMYDWWNCCRIGEITRSFQSMGSVV